MISYDLIPEQVLLSLRAYADHHLETGGFLRSVLANDLMESVGRADHDSLVALPSICSYVYNEIPGACHGSPEKVAAWIKGRKL